MRASGGCFKNVGGKAGSLAPFSGMSGGYVKSGLSFATVHALAQEDSLAALTPTLEDMGSPLGETNYMQAVKFPCDGELADSVVETLLSLGASACSVEDAQKGVPGKEQEIFYDGPVPWATDSPRELWKESYVTALFAPGHSDPIASSQAAVDAVGGTWPGEEYIVVERIGHRDWVTHAQDQFQPLEICDGFWVVPRWCTLPEQGRFCLILEPGLAFGTGEHATTRLCLKWLRESMEEGMTVLDYGTGSGILAIAALKMGGSRAVGVDIDPQAVSSARYNASLNDIDSSILHVCLASEVDASGDGHTQRMDDPHPNEFDVIIANILLNPLLALRSRLLSCAKIGAKIALSGVLEEQVPLVLASYGQHLQEISVTTEDGWACVSAVVANKP